MDELYKKFIQDVENNYPKHKDKILDALTFATKSHEGIVRRSGEPYIIHPIAVARILIDNQMDYSTVIAGLLHDVVEDTEISLREVEKRYGKTVAKLVDGVTKIDKITAQKENLTDADDKKRLLLAMGDDIRVIFIKLADRLHNMRTIKYLSPEKQQSVSRETQELFIPIAELLGVRNLRSELQSLVFECLNKDSYEKIKVEQDRRVQGKKKKFVEIEKKLNDAFKKNGIVSQVTWWPERYYSIYKKMKQTGFNKAYGLVLFKIIVPTISDCYKALGVVHQLYKPIPSQIKDFIASPKINGYQSLQSVVLTEDSSITFNVMIRTPEMNNVCEYGVFALAKSKDLKEDFNTKFEKYNKLKSIILGESSSEFIESKSFVEAVKTDLSSKETWVFTPKFKPTKIDTANPRVIDFAYTLSEQMGNNALSAIINGKPASLGASIKSGDVVEIILSSEDKAPCRAWLNVAKAHATRVKIREYFEKNLNLHNVKIGKKLIHEEFAKNNCDIKEIAIVYEKVKPLYGFSSLDDMFSTVGVGGLKASQILAHLPRSKKCNGIVDSPVCVEGEDSVYNVILAKCCCPIHGDEIVAVKTKQNLTIHTLNCLNLKGINKENLRKANWKQDISQIFEINLKVVAKDSLGFGSKILGLISSLGVDITKLFAKTRGSDCEFKITLKIKNAEELESISQKIANLEGVKSINRCFE